MDAGLHLPPLLDPQVRGRYTHKLLITRIGQDPICPGPVWDDDTIGNQPGLL